MNANRKDESLKKIEAIFRDIFLDEHMVISEKTSPADIDEWDSLAHINILSGVEKEFKVHFSAEDIGNIVDVSSMLTVLSERQAFDDAQVKI